MIATLFELIEGRGTAKFEGRLVNLLMSAPDAAAALRQAQVEALGEWRAGVWRAGRTNPLAEKSPLIWAAYACLGGRQAPSRNETEV